jgi:hypothetical protein
VLNAELERALCISRAIQFDREAGGGRNQWAVGFGGR